MQVNLVGEMGPGVQRNDARLVHHLVSNRHITGALDDLVRVAVDRRIIDPGRPRVMQRTYSVRSSGPSKGPTK
jgi:hypothetical protein